MRLCHSGCLLQKGLFLGKKLKTLWGLGFGLDSQESVHSPQASFQDWLLHGHVAGRFRGPGRTCFLSGLSGPGWKLDLLRGTGTSPTRSYPSCVLSPHPSSHTQARNLGDNQKTGGLAKARIKPPLKLSKCEGCPPAVLFFWVVGFCPDGSVYTYLVR